MTDEPEDGAIPERESEVPAKKRRPSVNRGVESGKAPSKNGGRPHRGRIIIEGEGLIVPLAEAPMEAGGSLSLAIPEPEPGRQLVVPSSAELQIALAQANTLEELVHFDKMIAVLQAAGKEFRVVADESIRIATAALSTGRKVGTILLQVEARGGDRAKCHADTLLKRLLRELGTGKAKRYRAIARIEEPSFDDYLKSMTDQRKVPTEAGVLRHARKAARASGKVPAKPKKARKPKAAPAGELVFPPAILDCVHRILGDIDVCVGDAKVKCKRTLKPDAFQPTDLRGAVFISECLYPSEWLPKLAKLRRNAGINEVLVALPAETSSQWFKDLMEAEDEWVCCFPTGVRPPLLLAHLGPHQVLNEACREVGPVVICLWRRLSNMS